MNKVILMFTIIFLLLQFPSEIKAGSFYPDYKVTGKKFGVNINFDSGDSYVEVHVYTKEGKRIMVPVKINNPYGTGAGVMKLVFKTRYCGEYQFPTFKPDGTSMASGTYINFGCVNYNASKPITDPSKLIENFKSINKPKANIDFRKYEGQWCTTPNGTIIEKGLIEDYIDLDFIDKTHAKVQIANKIYNKLDGSDALTSLSSISTVTFNESGITKFTFKDSYSGGKGEVVISLKENGVSYTVSFPKSFKENKNLLKINFRNAVLPYKRGNKAVFL